MYATELREAVLDSKRPFVDRIRPVVPYATLVLPRHFGLEGEGRDVDTVCGKEAAAPRYRAWTVPTIGITKLGFSVGLLS